MRSKNGPSRPRCFEAYRRSANRSQRPDQHAADHEHTGTESRVPTVPSRKRSIGCHASSGDHPERHGDGMDRMMGSATEIEGSTREPIIFNTGTFEIRDTPDRRAGVCRSGEELDVERFVEASDVRMRSRCSALHCRRRGSRRDRGREPQQQKHKQRHHAHDGNGGEHAEAISEHSYPLVVDRRTASIPGIVPLTA